MKKNNTVIQIEDLVLSYQKDRRKICVFDHFSMKVSKGEKVVLLGESGSGKSTLARVLTGLLPPSAKIAQGHLSFRDLDMDLSKNFMYWNKLRGKKVSMIFQDAREALNPVLTVYQHFCDLLLYHKVVQKKGVHDFAKNILEKLRFDDPELVLQSYPFQLSGGMCQRVCIALCISLEPEILIADEPTSALDIVSQAEVLSTLKNLPDQTVLMITHDISAANALADKIIVLEKGVICESDSKEAIINRPKDPYTKRLISSYTAIEEIHHHRENPSKEPALRIRNLTKTYGKGKNVVDNLSFDVYQEEIFGILGESGCGKSTLSRCIMGLEQITSGEILYKDQNLLQLKPRTRRSLSPHIQMIFQEARGALHPYFSALDIVQEPLVYNKLFDSKTREKIARDMLEMVGLDENTYRRKPPQLSTGQCQRVGIARALVTKPQILICDEPVSALDVSTQLQILELLIRLKKEFHLTMIMISHDFRILKNISHRIGVMYQGKFIEVVEEKDRFSHSQNPYVQKIVAVASNMTWEEQ